MIYTCFLYFNEKLIGTGNGSSKTDSCHDAWKNVPLETMGAVIQKIDTVETKYKPANYTKYKDQDQKWHVVCKGVLLSETFDEANETENFLFSKERL